MPGKQYTLFPDKVYCQLAHATVRLWSEIWPVLVRVRWSEFSVRILCLQRTWAAPPSDQRPETARTPAGHSMSSHRTNWVGQRSAARWTSDPFSRRWTVGRPEPSCPDAECVERRVCQGPWERWMVLGIETCLETDCRRLPSTYSRSAEHLTNIKQAVVLKHSKPRPRVAHRGIARFLGADQKCNQVVPRSLHAFPENFMQIGPAVSS